MGKFHSCSQYKEAENYTNATKSEGRGNLMYIGETVNK